MAFLEWEDRYGLGVATMDDQHRRLIDRMNELHDRVEAGADRVELLLLVDQLAARTAQHFADEEQYMTSIGFAGLAAHRTIHERLIGRLTEHREALANGAPLGPEFFSFLRVWLSSHICGVDTKYAAVGVGAG